MLGCDLCVVGMDPNFLTNRQFDMPGSRSHPFVVFFLVGDDVSLLTTSCFSLDTVNYGFAATDPISLCPLHERRLGQ